MNEDEAFIRAIVDSPGDDTPRLVYADWLDDRDDPRGPYLRAELEWAKPWRSGERPADNPALCELAVGLDLLWVARMSRPSVGVCCDHLEFRKSRIRVNVDDLDQVEQQFNLTLPLEYRAFLLNYNGGRSKLNGLPHPEFDRVHCELQPWYSLKPAQEPPKHENVLSRIRCYRSYPETFHTLIPLCAADAGYYEAFAIGYGKENMGCVYHVWDFALSPVPTNRLKIADSLGGFLALIQDWVEPSVIDPDNDPDIEPPSSTHHS